MPLTGRLLFALALALPAASARANGKLDKAIELFQTTDDEQAARLCHEVIRQAPASEDAARAHLYLALIALNALDRKAARGELAQALRIDPIIDLPRHTSPKAQLFFDEVRRERLEQGAAVDSGPPAPHTSNAPVVAATAQNAEPAAPSPLPSILTLSAGAAALAVGIAFGTASLSNQNSLNSQNQSSSGANYYSAWQASQAAANNGRVADVLFGVAGLAGVVGGVLLVTELMGGSGAHVSMAATPNGAAAAIGGSF